MSRNLKNEPFLPGFFAVFHRKDTESILVKQSIGRVDQGLNLDVLANDLHAAHRRGLDGNQQDAILIVVSLLHFVQGVADLLKYALVGARQIDAFLDADAAFAEQVFGNVRTHLIVFDVVHDEVEHIVLVFCGIPHQMKNTANAIVEVEQCLRLLIGSIGVRRALLLLLFGQRKSGRSDLGQFLFQVVRYFGRSRHGFGVWKSEVGVRKSEVGVRKSEVGVRRSEVGVRRSEVGVRK